MKNSITLSDLESLSASKTAKMPIEQIVLLVDELSELKALTKKYDGFLHNLLVSRFSDEADKLRGAAGKDTGSVRIEVDGYVVTADLAKDVDWDQGALRRAATAIAAMNEPVEDYVTIKYSVPESKYKAWPQSIKAIFDPARTVNTKKPTFKIEKGK